MMKVLKNLGFKHIRTKGSHHIMQHPDGRAVTVPVHAARTLSTGTLKGIVKEKLGMIIEEFFKYIHNKKK
jgi:predicted RNA binding protein YcfA (HicA-like mRNA interferase family)